jgi:hypothetical protein
VAKNASSRTTISVTIETDASKRPGNPIVNVTQPGKAGVTSQVTEPGDPQVIKTGEAKTGLPSITGSRDISGNAVLNFTQDTKNPLEPGAVTPGIRSDLNVTVAQSGSWVEASGMISATPSFELNVTDANGNTTNVPLGGEPSGDAFGPGLFVPLDVDILTPLVSPPPAPCLQMEGGNSCQQAQ